MSAQIATLAASLASIIAVMLALLKYFQEQARRREAAINLRINTLRDEGKVTLELFHKLRNEMQLEYVRDHEMRELRTEMKEQFSGMGAQLSSLSNKLADVGATIGELIGRLNSTAKA